MNARWLFILLGVLSAATVRAEFESATLEERLSGFSDENQDGVPDSLMDYLIASSVTLPDPYDPSQSDLDGDGYDDFSEWVLFLDPLVEESQSGSSGVSSHSSTGVCMRVALPVWINQYAELFSKESLTDENLSWQLIDEWIPTYGEQEVEINISTESNSCLFISCSDATWDCDGDGHSDFYEYLTQTDQDVFNDLDEDEDGMHDWWEIKLFGDLSQCGTDDFDSDGLLNNEELVWLSTSNIVLYSDPSLSDSDADTLNDYAETVTYGTEPMEADTDEDGLDDDEELLAALPTDPNNSDITAPVVTFAGSF